MTLPLILTVTLPIKAHPVIYKNGTVYWGSFAPDMNIQRISYTFHPKLSVEANSSWYLNNDNYRDYTLGTNILLKRFLKQNAQANIYAGYHLGLYEDNISSGLVQHAMLSADWESRKIYTAANAMSYIYNNNIQMKYSYRFGVAPYVAGMNNLQSWLVLKVDYFKPQNNNIIFTPLMRFFYKNVLWEMGSSTQGDFFITLMTHF